MVDSPDRDDRSAAFPTLARGQIEVLKRFGEVRPMRESEVLFKEGDASYDFIVILEGLVEIRENFRGESRTVARHGVGRFLGEMNMFTGQAVYLTALVTEPGEAVFIPPERLKEIVAEEPGLSELILRAFLMRRVILSGLGTGLKVVGSRYSEDTLRLREFATRNGIPHAWIDLEEDEGAEALLREFGVEPSETPVVIWQGIDVLKNPTNAELSSAIGLGADMTPEDTYDLVVIGAGPAGARRLGLRCFRRSLHHRARRRGPRRTSGNFVQDRELPGFPGGALRLGACEPGHDPGRQVRRALSGTARGRRPTTRERALPR